MGLSTESGTYDPYEVLGLTREASASAIRTAYKKLALRYHPDKHRDEKQKQEMSEQFTRIQEAYETLNDPRKKQEYDESCEIEAEIQEQMKRAQEMKSRLKKEKEEKKKREMEKKAEYAYINSKTKEEILIAEALKVQAARKMSAFQSEQRRSSAAGDDKAYRKGEEKRKKSEKKIREEEIARREREELDRLERMRREEEHKRHDVDQERRDRDRRKDRVDKNFSRTFEFDEEPYGFDHETFPHDRGDRGRSSRERLRGEPLSVQREHSPRPRDGSRQRGGAATGRDRSRNRDKERDHSRHREGPRDKERERVRQQMYDNGVPGAPRRASSDPVYDSNYLRTPQSQPYNGSPPSYAHFSGPAPGTRSPPDSPQMKYANAPPGSSATYSTSGGKGRTRDRAVPRKHSEAASYVPREGSYPNVPEELAHSTPGTRDSGYCSSSNQTPLKNNLDTRKSSERVTMDGGKPAAPGNKKYKYELRFVPVEVDTDEDSDDQSNKNSARGNRHRAASYEEHPSPRHASASAVDADGSVFDYMLSGSNANSYPTDKTFFSPGPKGTSVPHHTRHHSNNQSPPKINLDGSDIRYVPASGYAAGRHHSTREVPPVGGGSHYRDIPGLHRGATWNG